MENTISPITGTNNIKLLKEIECSNIIVAYKKIFNINVEKFFLGIPKIFLYECEESGYKFFYPSIEGDGDFYSQLQKYPWYYSDWKWENEIALKFIKNNDKVLDVGSAKGSFLKSLQSKGNEVFGLETNVHAAIEARAQGITIYEEHLDIFKKREIKDFDVISFFQVLEHIYDIKETINYALYLLKVGGKLIISVPNNGSFIKDDVDGFLNMPPHHVGLWDERSLSTLADIFDMKLLSIEFEPLQTYHFNYYFNINIGYKIQKKFGIVGKIFNRIAVFILTPFLFVFRNKIKGHTILAVYQKK